MENKKHPAALITFGIRSEEKKGKKINKAETLTATHATVQR
jgi:hypothetical protein